MESGEGWGGQFEDTDHSMQIVNKVLNGIDCSMPLCRILNLENLNTKELLNFTNLFNVATFDSTILPADLYTLFSGAFNPANTIIGANT